MRYGRIGLVVAALRTCAAGRVACPRIEVPAEGATHSLASARVLQHPATSNVEVRSMHGHYDLPARTDGAGAYSLVCAYNETTDTQTVEIPSSATTCDVSDAGSGTVAGCQ